MKILLVEDERKLSESITEYLSSDHYLCEQAFDFDEAMEKISLYQYDCILLDLTLPGGDGLKILEKIREMEIKSGIIIISARNSLDDKIKGLEIGADDYISKPFSLPELKIRIYALMRRQNFSHNNIIKNGDIDIDLLSRTVFVKEKKLNLTKTEYELLLFLIGNSNMVISKDSIAEHLSGDMADMLDSQDFVYAHIKNLKAKLSKAGCKKHIKTIYGTGYQWMEQGVS